LKELTRLNHFLFSLPRTYLFCATPALLLLWARQR